jgi:ABC-type multidrug transport system ATPase subunit
MSTIIADKLVKAFGDDDSKITALNALSFEVDKGEIFGIIGSDGAGKTTLYRILTSVLLPDSGSAIVNGVDVVKNYKTVRKQVGYMPGRFSLYPDLTVEENLEFFATIFNTTVKDNYELIRDIYVQLKPFKDRRAGKLSGGMKQKLGLCCALIHKPAVLFLDEPTTGVDAVSRKDFWEILQRLKKQEITILVSTSYMDEASLCDRVALVQNGERLSLGTPKEIINSYQHSLVEAHSEKMLPLLEHLSQYEKVKRAYVFGEIHHAVLNKDYDFNALKQYLLDKGHTSLSIQSITPTIEDCFIDLMHYE